jgi:hypothetical protein
VLLEEPPACWAAYRHQPDEAANRDRPGYPAAAGYQEPPPQVFPRGLRLTPTAHFSEPGVSSPNPGVPVESVPSAGSHLYGCALHRIDAGGIINQAAAKTGHGRTQPLECSGRGASARGAREIHQGDGSGYEHYYQACWTPARDERGALR